MMSENAVSTTRRGAEIDEFLERLETSPTPASGSGRLIFGLDATASRQPTWDQGPPYPRRDVRSRRAGQG
jgi:hypothetical protein